MSTKRIIRNAARCLKCGEEIESKAPHDLRWCSCRALGVDGGREYLRRLYREGTSNDDRVELTEYEEVT